MARERCEKQDIPDYLAEYIQFRSNGNIHLIFKNEEELKKVLHWIKFKSKIGGSIGVGK